MTTALGSMAAAGRAAMGALIELGKSRLTALVGGHVASFGDVCWQTDSRLAQVLQRPDGRRYHPESIARVRRQLRDEGLITSERVFVGDKIQGAKFLSSRGTTVKRFIWPAVHLKNPFSRRERRLVRQAEAKKSRDAGEAMPPRPRHSAVIEPHHYTPPPPAWALELAAKAQSAQAAREAREGRAPDARSGPAPARVSAPGRSPPDG